MCGSNARNRGRLLAACMMVYYLGTVLGQHCWSGTLPTGLMDVLPWVTGLVLAAIPPPLSFRPHCQRAGRAAGQPGVMVHAAPPSGAAAWVNGCIISGIVLGSLYGLMPLYLNHQGWR